MPPKTRDILQAIQNDLAIIKTDVGTLKTDVATLKTDVATLKTDVATLKTDVKGLKTDVIGLLDWRKKMIDAQEDKTASVIENTLLNYCNMCVVKRLDIRIFYDTSGKQVTDFDSCFLVTPEVSVPSRSHSTKQEKRLSASINKLNSVSPAGSRPYLIVVENKTTIDKKIIESKLLQHEKIVKNIDSSRGDISRFSRKYVSMVEKHRLDKLPNTVYLVFACDSMSYALKKYIDTINKGITKEEYESMSVDLIRDDRTYRDIVASPQGTLLANANSFDAMNKIINDLYVQNIPGAKHLLDSVQDYDKLKDVFASVKGLLGHIIHDKLIVDTLYATL